MCIHNIHYNSRCRTIFNILRWELMKKNKYFFIRDEVHTYTHTLYCTTNILLIKFQFKMISILLYNLRLTYTDRLYKSISFNHWILLSKCQVNWQAQFNMYTDSYNVRAVFMRFYLYTHRRVPLSSIHICLSSLTFMYKLYVSVTSMCVFIYIYLWILFRCRSSIRFANYYSLYNRMCILTLNILNEFRFRYYYFFFHFLFFFP